MTKAATFVLAFCLVALTAFGNEGDGIVGVWDDEDHRAKIEIFNCNGHYCGKIVSLKEPLYPADDQGGMGGKPVVDRENPDREKRNRPLQGLQIMKGFTYSGDNTWVSGTIYDPETGYTYRGKIALTSPNRLKLKGYLGVPFFGRSTVWTR